MNMFQPVKAKNTTEYFKSLTPERRAALRKIDALIKKAAPKLKPAFSYNMPGYGAFAYTNYKKEKILWPVIALASQKNYISVYVCAVDNGTYVAEKFKKHLGKVSVGRSCIRFKKLEDVNLEALKKVIKLAAAHPGLISAGEHKRKK